MHSRERGGKTAAVVSLVSVLSCTGTHAAAQFCTHPLFFGSQQFGVGDGPVSVALGDLDGDSDVDMVVANLGDLIFHDDSIYVLRNNGDGTFVPDLYGIEDPTAVAVGDLDGDTDLDITVTQNNEFVSLDTVSVFANNGDGTFAAPAVYGGQIIGPKSVAVGDLNGDSHLDLVLANTGSITVAVLLNLGDGTFGPLSDYGTGVTPNSVAVGDLDGDLDLDLAVANGSSNSVSVLRNNGNGTFATHVRYGTGVGPRSVAMGDVDGDTDVDLVVANGGSNSVSVLLNNGDATFAPHTPYPVGDEPRSARPGDLNGDGHPDLAVANSASSDVSVLLNNGDGTFASQGLYTAGVEPADIAMGDLGGNANLDLAVVNVTSDDVSVLVNQCPGGPPANDDCADATVISGAFFEQLLDTTEATVEAGELEESCWPLQGNSHSVWYRYTPPQHGRININAFDSTYPTVVTVFSGTCGLASEVSCNADAGGAQLQDVVVSAGTSYLIKVSSLGKAGGGLLDFSFFYEPSSVPPPGLWTVLVHGAASIGNYPGVLGGIAARIGSFNANEVVLHTMDRDTFGLIPPDMDPAKHHVVQFDWTATASAWEDLPRFAADGYSYAAGDALYAFLRHYGISQDVHCLLGYSRGAVVMSEVTRRLILDGTPPDQVIYLDGEGGGNWPSAGCGGPIFQDCRFDAWDPNDAIRYDNIFSTVFEGDFGCPVYDDLGGNEKIRCYNYNLGQAYRHGGCGSGPPSIVTYLSTGIIYDGSRYVFPDSADSPPLDDGLDPDDWDGVEHVADRTLFNGNFGWASDAGWQSHGAAGTGQVIGTHLELSDNDEFLQHSWFFLRDEYVTLSFSYRVSNNDVIDCDDSFHVTLTALEDGASEDWFVIDRCAETPWLTFSVPVPEGLRSKVCTISFWKDPGGDGGLDSVVLVDDVTFLVQGDIDGDGNVGITDLLAILATWGPCTDPCPPFCFGDIDGDCNVGILDLLLLLGNWS